MGGDLLANPGARAAATRIGIPMIRPRHVKHDAMPAAMAAQRAHDVRAKTPMVAMREMRNSTAMMPKNTNPL
jgi:hypothetical protein